MYPKIYISNKNGSSQSKNNTFFGPEQIYTFKVYSDFAIYWNVCRRFSFTKTDNSTFKFSLRSMNVLYAKFFSNQMLCQTLRLQYLQQKVPKTFEDTKQQFISQRRKISKTRKKIEKMGTKIVRRSHPSPHLSQRQPRITFPR